MVVPEEGQQQIGIGPLITHQPLLHLCNQSTFQPFWSRSHFYKNFKEAFLVSDTRKVGNINWLLICHPGQVKTCTLLMSQNISHMAMAWRVAMGSPLLASGLWSPSTTTTRSLLNHDPNPMTPFQTHQSLIKHNEIGPYTPSWFFLCCYCIICVFHDDKLWTKHLIFCLWSKWASAMCN